MGKEKNFSIKLRNISIENYKGIDSFSMDFPKRGLSEDLDILIMGSENGLGKTSIIECCALLLISRRIESEYQIRDRYLSIDVPDLLIRAGSDIANITGEITFNSKTYPIGIEIHRSGKIKNIGDFRQINLSNDSDGVSVNKLVENICGVSPNPVIENSFMLFHSYRKIQEGNPDMGRMVRGYSDIRRIPPHRRFEMPLSEFKILILRSLMNRAGLFEFPDEQEAGETFEKLNELLKFFAGGTISKLRPSIENTIDLRILPIDGGKSFTFDGLSSGQKEIISTLFLIWHHTKNNPSVVFIDEPELHLNAQWHRSFVNNLIMLAPKNQYIFATHSEEIMDSVPKNRRILLLNKN
ncbi:MAG: AAA family ATPase [Gammaproteobacteria bacterium]|nr:AAA family ATPase [Gammaproteobacteria bacterium]